MARAAGQIQSDNLSLQPTPLIGRREELTTARQQLLADGTRLLTLTGPAGVGKTRLALAIAAELRETFTHGTYFVDLSPLDDPTLVPSAIAQALGVGEAGNRPLAEVLAAYLRERHLLLVLDNFEHLLEAASAVAELLGTCPGLSVLATSRERLRLRWEHALVVPPLAFPDVGRPLDPDALAQVDSVALFLERARSAAPDYALTPQTAPAVAALCARLDGLPLAIELAAARVSVLSPGEILARMKRRLSLLPRRAPDMPARHQTLHEAISWSYDLLPAEEQALFRRLSVFAGGWTLEAAEAVAATDQLGLDVLDGLAALAEKSLVHVTHGLDDRSRFGMLETVRDYALGQLADSGELEATRRQHATYFLTLAERTETESRGPHQQLWFDRLEREHDNLRAALRWSSEDGEPLLGLRMVSALWFFWWLRGHVGEGRLWLDTNLAASPEAPDELRLKALEGAGTLAGWQGQYDHGTGLLDEALRMTRALGDDDATVRVLGRVGWVAWANGRFERAPELAEELRQHRETADAWNLAYSFLSLGSLLHEAGQDDAAVAALEQSLAFFEAAQEKHGVAFARTKLALLVQDRGDAPRASRLAAEGVEFAGALNDAHVIAYCADDIAQLIGEQGPPIEMVRLLAAVDGLRETLSLPRTPRERASHADLLAALRRRVDEKAFDATWAASRDLPPHEVAEAAVICLR